MLQGRSDQRLSNESFYIKLNHEIYGNKLKRSHFEKLHQKTY